MLKRLMFFAPMGIDIQQLPGGTMHLTNGYYPDVCVVPDGRNGGAFTAAPVSPLPDAWSIATIRVDYAGWTEAVIQRGPVVLINQTADCSSVCRGSSFDLVEGDINLDVTLAASSGCRLAAAGVPDGLSGPVGSPTVHENIGCPNTYEVTL